MRSALMLGMWLAITSVASPCVQTTSRANVSSDGRSSIDIYFYSFSADGRYVAFGSWDPFLVPGVSNGYCNINVHDRATGETEVASVDANGAAGNLSSFPCSISPDGGYVAFSSDATNFVPGIANGKHLLYLRDRSSRTTSCVSVDPTGAAANGWCGEASISAGGRYVAFKATATNLVPGDTNGLADIFVRDRQAATTTRVNVDSLGAQSDGDSWLAGISPDGRFVLFSSLATNLVPADTNGTVDAFVRDLQNGSTERVSVSSSGMEGDGESWGSGISADGRFVLMSSAATNLVPGDTNGKWDAFVRDRQSGTTERVSLAPGGIEGNDDTSAGGLSADGRYVVLTSRASNLLWVDNNGKSDVFLVDRLTGDLEILSLSFHGEPGNGDSYGGPVSTDGRCVLFSSEATNLTPPPHGSNGFENLFVRDRGPTLEAYCFGDGSGAACPCGNSGSGGRGCDNSDGTGGAVLRASGRSNLANDSLVLVAEGVKANTSCILLQGNLAAPARVFGDGLLCIGGRPTRLFVKTATGTLVRTPGSTDPSVSRRSAVRGQLILAGASRFYQTYYRDADPNYCPMPTGNDWNISSGLAIVWNY